MTFNPDIHHRHSIRLRGFDYASAGAYFVTICAWQRECLFGDVVDDEMQLNDLGRIVNECWQLIPAHFPLVKLDAFIIMPNHVHGIITMHDVGAQHAAPESLPGHKWAQHAAPLQVSGGPNVVPGSLGAMVRSYKSATTKRINELRNNRGCPVWQRNYYERVLRNDSELVRAREYIVNNPLKWDIDENNPATL